MSTLTKKPNVESKKLIRILLPILVVAVIITVAIFMGNILFAKNDSVKFNFDPQGGRVNTTSIEYKQDTRATGLPIPMRKGFEFMGWYTEKRGSDKVYEGYYVDTKKDNINLYAKWAPTWYMQSDERWGSIPYGSKTINDIGCGPTSLSMALSTLTDNKITPVEACKWSEDHDKITSKPGRIKLDFFIEYAKVNGIKVTQLNTKDLKTQSKTYRDKINKEAWDAVEDGNWVIALSTDGNWAQYGHYILWYDIVGDNILARDPASRKPERLENKFSVLKAEAVRYYVIEVPEDKKLS